MRARKPSDPTRPVPAPVPATALDRRGARRSAGGGNGARAPGGAATASAADAHGSPPPAPTPDRPFAERFELVAEAIAGFAYDVDLAAGTTVRTAGLRAVTGVAPEDAEPTADWWYARVHPDDLPSPEAVASLVADPARTAFESEYRVRHADGRWVWVVDRARLLRDAAGRATRLVGLTVDITARKAAEAARAASEARLARVLETTPSPLVEFDVAGRIVYANAAAERTLHLTRGELAARSYDAPEWSITTLDGHRLPPDALPVGRALRGEHVADETLAVFDARAGDWRVFRINATPLRDDRDAVVGAIAAFEDVTARHAEARERERLLTAERVARERADRMRAATVALARALDEREVMRAALAVQLDALGAEAGSVWLLDEERRALRPAGREGYPADGDDAWPDVPLDADLPVAIAARDGVPVYLASAAEWAARFPTPYAPTVRARFAAMATLPMRLGGRIVGALAAGWRAPRAFPAEERELFEAIATQCAQALERARLLAAEHAAREAASRKQRQAEFLAEASRMLSASLDYEATLQAIARAAVPALADWCAVDMLATPRRPGPPGAPDAESAEPDVPGADWPPVVVRVAVAHEDPAKLAWARDLERRAPQDWQAPGGLPRVLREGVTEFYPVVTREMTEAAARTPEELALLREIGFSSFTCVPLVARGQILGAITLSNTDSGRHFDDDDRALAEDLARRASSAIDNARLFRDAVAANRAKADFLAVMSHELRTPLNAILGYAGLLEAGVAGPLDAPQREYVARGRDAARRLLGLVDDVLTFTKLEAGHVAVRVAPVETSALLDDVLPLVTPQAAAKGVALRVAPPEPPGAPSVRVVADRERAAQVLLNLLTNAVKFTPSGGTVTVRVRGAPNAAPNATLDATPGATPGATPRGTSNGVSPSPRVALLVEDTGIGIPAAQRERVFEPFVQLDGGHTRSAGGTGLGLAISRDLARAMGGDVTVAGAEGQGSAFALELPVARDPSPG